MIRAKDAVEPAVGKGYDLGTIHRSGPVLLLRLIVTVRGPDDALASPALTAIFDGGQLGGASASRTKLSCWRRAGFSHADRRQPGGFK
jgi:hypothetical protein